MAIAPTIGTDAAAAATSEPPLRLDLAHLTRMTLGNRGLEAEVLQLFLQQAPRLAERFRAGGSEAIAALAHTLKGSARGIGAWQLAAAAERVERAAGDDERSEATAQLLDAVAETCAAVQERLRQG